LAYKIAGTTETVRSLSIDDVRAHHRRHYVAGNMVLVAAGPVEQGRILELAERTLGQMPRGERTSETAPELAPLSEPAFLFVSHDESQTELQLSFPCPSEDHPDHAALNLIRAVLDDGLTSWLPYHIVEKRGLAYSIHAGIDVFADAAVFEIEAACTPAKVVSVYDEVIGQMARLCAAPLPDGELERVKRRHRIGLDFALDDLNALAGWYGATELFRDPETFEERLEKLEAVTPDHMLEVARRVFRPENLYVCAVGPSKARAEAKLHWATQQAW
jgi:predicted Zn-dependent peptidase